MMDQDTQLLRSEAELLKSEARRKKSERTKHLGEPIKLPAKPLDVIISGNEIWMAQSDAVVHRVDLESGSTLQVFKGHTAPVTTIAFIEESATSRLLVSGSWDKTVKIWDTKDKSLLSSTKAHSDFVKCVFVLPELKLLVTSGSDKVVRLWDLSNPRSPEALKTVGIISVHTRPVQCVAAEAHSSSSATLYTADSMGVIKIWSLERTADSCRAMEIGDVAVHRTGVNEMLLGENLLWTASSDETAQITHLAPPSNSTPAASPDTSKVKSKPIPAFTYPSAVRAILPLQLTPLAEPLLLTGSGDAFHTYDISDPYDPELLSTTDAHWFDIVALRLWVRRVEKERNDRMEVTVEPWIVSVGLDQTVRKWRLSDLVKPPKDGVVEKVEKEKKVEALSGLTAEEEAELAELMNEDD